MEEAFELTNYLPLSFKTSKEQEYVDFLWDAFESNYQTRKFQFAFLAYHMLTMSFVYFKIWQIKQNEPKDFEKAMVGFSKDLEKELLEATTPFAFWRINESSTMRFLKLIGCGNDKVGTYAALVKERNDSAHTNGNIFFSEQSALDRKLVEILRIADEIQDHSKSLIDHCYHDFLIQYGNPDDREFSDINDQVREILIRRHYLSPKDIQVCLAHDISLMQAEPNFSEIKILHQSLRAIYSDAETTPASTAS